MNTSSARRLVAAAVAACTTAGGLLLLAPAADAATPRPTVTISASAHADGAEVVSQVNRRLRQISYATCRVDDAPSDWCGPARTTRTSTTFVLDVEAPPGDHTVRIHVRLEDGTHLYATTGFEVPAPASPHEAACGSVGGTVAEYFAVWECSVGFPSLDDVDAVAVRAALAPECGAPEGEQIPLRPVVHADGVDVIATCYTESAIQVIDSCFASSASASANAYRSGWYCLTDSADVLLAQQLTDLCSSAGGVSATSEEWGQRRYECNVAPEDASEVAPAAA